MTIPILPMEFTADSQSTGTGLVDKQKWLREWEKQNYSTGDKTEADSAGRETRPQVLPAEGREIERSRFAVEAMESERAYSFELARIQSANRANMPVTVHRPLAYRQAQVRGPAGETATFADAAVDRNAVREGAVSRKLVSLKQDIPRLLEKAKFDIANVHVSVQGKEVNLWFRDYRKGAARRITSTIEATISLLRENGYTLAAVNVNGLPLRKNI